MLNEATLIGNVGSIPEIRSTQAGKEVASLSLATSESWKDKVSGERKSITEWHKLVVFNDGLVKFIKSYVNKGDMLYIKGTIKTRKWQDKAGQDRYSTEIVLNSYDHKLLKLNKSQNAHDSDQEEQRQEAPSVNSDLDDEIPFS